MHADVESRGKLFFKVLKVRALARLNDWTMGTGTENGESPKRPCARQQPPNHVTSRQSGKKARFLCSVTLFQRIFDRELVARLY